MTARPVACVVRRVGSAEWVSHEWRAGVRVTLSDEERMSRHVSTYGAGCLALTAHAHALLPRNQKKNIRGSALTLASTPHARGRSRVHVSYRVGFQCRRVGGGGRDGANSREPSRPLIRRARMRRRRRRRIQSRAGRVATDRVPRRGEQAQADAATAAPQRAARPATAAAAADYRLDSVAGTHARPHVEGSGRCRPGFFGGALVFNMAQTAVGKGHVGDTNLRLRRRPTSS